MSIALLLASWALVAEPQSVIHVDPRVPFPVALTTPSGARGGASRTEVIEELTSLLKRHTDLDPRFLTDEKVQKILLESASPTVDLARLASEELEGQGAPYLLLVRYDTLPGDQHGADQISGLFVRLDRIRELMAQGAGEDPQWPLEVESEIFEQALPKEIDADAVGRTVRVETAGEVRAHLEHLVTNVLRPVFEADLHWERLTQVQLRSSAEGLRVKVDGREVGVTASGVTELADIAMGSRVITLEHPDYVAFTETLTVDPGEQAEWRPELVSLRRERARTPRAVTFWSGLTVAAVGAVFVGVAAAQHGTRPATDACATVLNDCGDLVESGFTTLGDSGVLTAPLGFSLFGAGAATSLGVALGNEERWPWLPILAGLIVGGTSYAVSAAVNQ